MTATIIGLNGYDWITVTGESLLLEPGLTPRPSSGIRVLFRFEMWTSEEFLLGIACLCGIEATDVDLMNLRDASCHQISPNDIATLPGKPMVNISLADLAGMRLKNHGGQQEQGLTQILVREALKAFLADHTVTVRASVTRDDDLVFEVDFSRPGAAGHAFAFEVPRASAKKLLMFR